MGQPTLKQILDFTALEKIQQHPPAHHDLVKASDALADLFETETSSRNWVQDMIRNGLLSSMKDTRYVRLSSTGEQLVESLQLQRDDRSKFKQEICSRLLNWANNNSRGDDDLQDVDPDVGSDFWYYGRVITLDDIESAARYLKSKGLLNYTSEVYHDEVIEVMVGITTDGQECCDESDGDIKQHLAKQEASSRTGGPTFNIDTVINSNIVAGNGNSLSVELQKSQRVDLLGRLFKQALPVLGISESEQKAAEGYILILERSKNATEVNSALQWAKSFSSSISFTPLSSVLSEMADSILTFPDDDS